MSTQVTILRNFTKIVETHLASTINHNMDTVKTYGNQPRYVRCREDHLSEDFTKDHNIQNSHSKCAICANDHSSSLKEYPVFKSILAILCNRLKK